MDKEVLFAKKLEDIKRTAREQGNMLEKKQVEEAFADMELSEDRFAMIYAYLEKQNIGIGEAYDPFEYTSDEERNFLQMYLDDLETVKEYSEGEKRAFTIQAMAGEKDAQDKLVEIYLRNVVDLAKLYSNQGVLIEDLIGEGNVALAMGVTMLDSQEKPEDCEGLLIKMIMDAMEELIKEDNDISEVDKKALAKVNAIYEKAEKLSKDYGGKITVEQLCEEEHLSRKSVIDAIRISGFAIDCIETPDELKGVQ